MIIRKVLFYGSAICVTIVLLLFFRESHTVSDSQSNSGVATSDQLDQASPSNLKVNEDQFRSVGLTSKNNNYIEETKVLRSELASNHSTGSIDVFHDAAETIDLGPRIDPESLPVEDYDHVSVNLGKVMDPDDPALEAHWGADSVIELGSPIDP